MHEEELAPSMAGPPGDRARRTRLQTAGLSALAVTTATVALTMTTMGSSSGASVHDHVARPGTHWTDHISHRHHVGPKSGTPDDGGAGAAGGCGGG